MSIIWLCRLGEWVKVFNDNVVHCPSCFDLQLLLTPLVSSTFSFNSISVISSRSVLLFGETGVLGEDYRPVAIHWNKCIMESCIEYILPWAVFKLIGLVVIGTACTCSRKSNYQSITTTMANWSQLTDIWHEMFTKQGGMAHLKEYMS